MPEFTNPFPGGKKGKKLDKVELLSALRLALSAEEDAVHLYTVISNVSSDRRVNKILTDIAKEEQVHIGEIQKLIESIDGDEKKLVDDGKKEAAEKAGINEIINVIESTGDGILIEALIDTIYAAYGDSIADRLVELSKLFPDANKVTVTIAKIILTNIGKLPADIYTDEELNTGGIEDKLLAIVNDRYAAAKRIRTAAEAPLSAIHLIVSYLKDNNSAWHDALLR